MSEGLDEQEIERLAKGLTSRRYHPRGPSVSLVAIAEDDHRDGPHVTMANLICASNEEAVAMWTALRDEYEATGDEPEDVLVDLLSAPNDDIEENFFVSRQIAELIIARHLSKQDKDKEQDNGG